MVMSSSNVNTEEIRKFRDTLLTEKALTEQDKIKAQKAKENIELIFKNIDEEKIEKLESRNIFIRNLLNYDLDRVLEDKEYNQKFISEFENTLLSIKNLLEAERRSQ